MSDKKGLVNKKEFLIVIGALFVFGLLVLIWAATNAPVVKTPIAFGNYSGTINFTCWPGAMDNAMNVSLYYNVNGEAAGTALFMAANTTENQSFFENATFNTSLLGGDSKYYNITCFMTNLSNSQNYSVAISNITIDNTAPAVNFNGTMVNFGNYSGTIVINATVLDATIGMNGTTSAWFNITNSTKGQKNFSQMTNATASYALSFNTSLVSDGTYNITIYANDSLGNLNRTEQIQITVDNTAPKVTFNGTSTVTVVSGGNYSDVVTINATVVDSTIRMNSTNSDGTVSFNITNVSNGKNSIYDFMANATGSYYNNTFNTSLFTDGAYYLTIYAMDALGNFNKTERIQFTIDHTKPYNVTITSPVTNTNYSSTLVLNSTVLDLTAGIQTVFFNITNITGSQKAIVYAAREGSTSRWSNVTFNTSSLSDGTYNVTAWANDSAGNLNNTKFVGTFRMDNTAPSISFSCSKTQLYTGDVLTCSCSGTDPVAGVSTTVYTASPSTTDTGEFTKYCTVTDTAGNIGTSSASYTIELRGSGSSSGGGGGSSTVTTTKTSSWSSINTGTPVTMTGFSAGVGVKEIKLEVAQKANNVKVTVEKSDSKPSAVSISKENAYKYLHVETQNLTGKLSKAIMKIQVEKKWVSQKGLTKENISLFRYDDSANKWNELATTFKSEDNTYYYYDTELTGFSYFAIASKENLVSAEETPSAEDTTSTPSEEAETVQSGLLGISYQIWAIGIAAIIVIVAAVWIILAKRKK